LLRARGAIHDASRRGQPVGGAPAGPGSA
jgi:hypothetical protein